MAKHEISGEIPTATIVNDDLVVYVEGDQQLLGVLTMSRGQIDWRKAHARTKRPLSWDEFMLLMDDHAGGSRTATIA